MTGWTSPSHWVIIALLVLVLFGYKKLPEMSRSVGRSLRIFKTEIKGMDADDAARNSAEAPAGTPPVASAPAVSAPGANQPAAASEPVIAQPVAPPLPGTPAPVALPPAAEESPQQRTQA
ncbi:MAG TPA: Sec-independent protein translocase subunit TatA [Jatrophihabitans sp.]|jgi:sec-independent protein translocase protein TatA|uniref:Sec-independent protein translocase subunit TatA n=1 Tax=Jatrophihabitans sp. TaxID=1932789 RepID=UPI002F00E0E6